MTPKFTAACILIKNPENSDEFLAVARKNDGNVFGLPGGKVEDNESIIAAALREGKEETGLDFINLVLLFSRIDDNKNMCVTYLAEIIQGSIINPRPGEAPVKWVTRDILKSGPFGEYNAALFEEYDRINK